MSEMPVQNLGVGLDQRCIGNYNAPSDKGKQALEHVRVGVEEEAGVRGDFSFISREVSAPLISFVEDERVNNSHSPWVIPRRLLEHSSGMVQEEQYRKNSFFVSCLSVLPGGVDEGQSNGSNPCSEASRFEGQSNFRDLEGKHSMISSTEFEGSFGIALSKEVFSSQGNGSVIVEGSLSEMQISPPCSREQKTKSSHFADSMNLQKHKLSPVDFKKGNMPGENDLKNALKPNKRTIPRLLRLLIDNGVISAGEDVYYVEKSNNCVVKKGHVTRDGIICDCCRLVYGVGNFEHHGGRNHSHPSKNIFLCDGRSLFDCQQQLAGYKNLEGNEDLLVDKTQNDLSEGCNCCFFCHGRGELLVCTYCPSAYHLRCVGLKDIPNGDWYCPSCRCGICGEGEFSIDSEVFTMKTVIYCDQCMKEYHVGCLRERELKELKKHLKGSWFCSKKCSEIYASLHELLGKSNPACVEGLRWTILSGREKHQNSGASPADIVAEKHKKLLALRRVLDECFDWMPDPLTNRAIITDILFNKKSELKRMDYSNFFSMLLEKENKVLSVATIRIFGENAAEIPLVGTCRKYRRKGMCRLLMGELEKMISGLGVKSLLLPSPPALLDTWTTKFGFTKVEESERMELLQHAFLQFQGTTMCQKLLTKHEQMR